MVLSKLEKVILEHKKKYYEGQPIISDEEYDSLEERLRDENPESHVLQLVGSLDQSSKKIKHDKKMLSLEKKYEISELIKWVDNNDVIGTNKIDGVSCSLVYEGGKLIQAKTRGNGTYGEDITDKCNWVKSIPKFIKNKNKIEIRGELYCNFIKFERLKVKMLQIGEEEPSSPRNIVAGLMGRKEKLFLCEFIDFQSFDVVQKYDIASNENEMYEFLKASNFETPKFKVISNEEDLREFLSVVQEFIVNGDYQIDGAVFSFNSFELHRKLGSTAHHPKYKMAFKFKSASKIAKLLDIEWNISRNGVYTPVGIIEPIELSGAMVGRVTLHNYGNVIQNDLRPGDLIKVIRSGEVIPKFEEVVERSTNVLTLPEKCRFCDGVLLKKEIRIICVNPDCSGRLKYEILNYIDKIGIEDLSEKRIEPLISLGLVKKISDLYSLTVADFMKLPKTKEKLATKLFNTISQSKNVSLPIFLSALGLTGGALNKCEKIYNSGFNTINKVLNMSVSDLAKIDGFAEKSASEIVNSISNKKELILSLEKLGFKFVNVEAAKNGNLSNMSICVTGKLSQPRSEIQKLIKENGGTVTTGVGKSTDLLVCNDVQSTSSKMKNAKKFGIKIISEAEFYKLI